MKRVLLFVTIVALARTAGAQATAQGSLTSRGVPSGSPTASTLALSLGEAIRRGLTQNLAAILEQQEVSVADSARRSALADLLPRASGTVRQTVQVSNLAAFGFSGFGGFPDLIGPFTVFDARVGVSVPIVDLAASASYRSATSLSEAATADLADVREAVILSVGNLYLEAQADEARLAAARAEQTTADALVTLAQDQQAAGVVAAIDVIRQQVQQQAAKSRVIAADNQLQKRKLELARAIGLPAGQSFDLTPEVGYSPAPDLTLDTAVAQALAHRHDLVAAKARDAAATASHRAAVLRAMPSVHFDGDIGGLGISASTALRTYTAGASVHVPLFEGGARRADIARASAVEAERNAELADVDAGIRFEVAAALLDLQAATSGVDVARSAASLAQDELTQAQDRFRAGVTSSIELVQAQESVARASEDFITSVYAHNVAKANVARALGEVEERFLALVGGGQ